MNPDEFPSDASVMAILPSGSGNIQMEPAILNGPEHHYTMASLQTMAGVGGAYSTILPAPSTVPLDRSTVRKSPDEEEMDDVDESPEWAIRVGDAPPPAWGKRKASYDDEIDINKRARYHR